MARKGNALALSQLDMKFRAPLRSKDIVRGTVVTSKVTGARIIMDQELYRLPREGETNQQVTHIVWSRSRHSCANHMSSVKKLSKFPLQEGDFLKMRMQRMKLISVLEAKTPLIRSDSVHLIRIA